MSRTTSRRDVLKLAGAVTVAGIVPRARAQARGKIVVVGGGFGGATCARYLLRAAPGLECHTGRAERPIRDLSVQQHRPRRH